MSPSELRSKGVELRALTLWRPWDTAILHLGKDVENRPRPTKRRSWVAVHAGAHLDRDWFTMSESLHQRIADRGLEASPPCSITGLMRIDDCVIEHESDWFLGPYGYVIGAVHALPNPIPCVGMLGFWRVPDAGTSVILGRLPDAIRREIEAQCPQGVLL